MRTLTHVFLSFLFFFLFLASRPSEVKGSARDFFQSPEFYKPFPFCRLQLEARGRVEPEALDLPLSLLNLSLALIAPSHRP
jgi:hypothetical protein